MKSFDEVLEILEERVDRPRLEAYIARDWIRPLRQQTGLYFEEIDIARLQLVCHLEQDIQINKEGMDVVLSLLDQLYELRAHMNHVAQAINRQPPHIQTEINEILAQLLKASETP